MYKIFLALMLMLLFATSVLSDVHLLQKPSDGDLVQDGSLMPELTLINESSNDLLLSEIELSYYFFDSTLTNDEFLINVDSFSHGDVQNIHVALSTMELCEDLDKKSNKALIISFPNSGYLSSSDTLRVHLTITASNNETFNEKDDWSFRPANLVTDLNGVALFLADGGEEINGSIDVSGDVISGGSGIFSDGSHESRFKNRVLFYNNDTLMLRGGVFEGTTFFQGPVKVDSKSPLFYDQAAFKDGISVHGSNDPIIEHGSLFLNGSYKTEFSGVLEMNFATIYGRSDLQHFTGLEEKGLFQITSQHGDNSHLYSSDLEFIYDSINVPVEMPDMPYLNKELIDSFVINAEYGWNKLFGSSGATSSSINTVYDSINTNHPEKLIGGSNGFLVLRPVTNWAQNFQQDGGEVTANIIWLFDTVDLKASNGSMYRSAPTSISMIIVDNGKKLDRLSGYGHFRGMIWSENSSECIYSSNNDTISGAVLHKKGLFRTESNGAGPLVINYDSEVVQTLSEAGIIHRPDPLPVPADGMTIINGCNILWGNLPYCYIDTIPPLVEIVYPEDGQPVCDSAVIVEWFIDGEMQHVEVIENLVQGENIIVRSAEDEWCNISEDTIVVFADFTPKDVKIESPLDSTLTNQNTIPVQWSIGDLIQTVHNQDTLVEGENLIIRQTTNLCGDIFADTVLVIADFTAPDVVINTPANGTLTNQSSIAVEWMIDSVVQDTLTSAMLLEGENLIIRTASDAAGNTGADSVVVVADFTAPIVEIKVPKDSSLVHDSLISVEWYVDSVLQETDTVELLKNTGINQIVRTATDSAGNTGSDTVVVIYGTPADLQPIVLDISNLTTDPFSLVIEGKAELYIANNGKRTAPSGHTVVLFEDLDGDKKYRDSIDHLLEIRIIQESLEPESIAVVTYSISDTIQFAGNLIYATVDYSDIIEEDNETNNTIHSMYDCEFEPQVGVFDPVIQLKWNSSSNYSSYTRVMSAPTVANITDDNGDGLINNEDIPDIIFMSHRNHSSSPGYLRAISGSDASEIFTSSEQLYYSTNIAVGDIDGDSLIEIFSIDRNHNRIVAFEHNGELKWKSDAIIPSGPYHAKTVTIADVDSDGNPEILVGNAVVNSDGSTKWIGTGGIGSNMSVVADLNLDGKNEVIAGNTLYATDGSILWQNASIYDGYTSVANIDDDPYGEIISVGGGKVTAIDYDGTILWSRTIYGGGNGGAPTISNFDSDPYPEIGVAGGSYYVVFEHDGTEKWRDKSQDHSSNRTGSSVFDLDGDGRVEVMYADEIDFKIYNGETGEILFMDRGHSSGTGMECPVIADVDNDNQAEIIIAGDPGVAGLAVYGSASNSWVNTRKIWNQHSYHITNVNDDGTIPQHEAPSWQAHNSYRCNFSIDALTCVDLTASYMRIDNSHAPDTVGLIARIGNGSALDVPSGVNVAFYNGDPRTTGELLSVEVITERIPSGSFIDITTKLVNFPIGMFELFAVADDNGTGFGAIRESDEENNYASSEFYLNNNAPRFISTADSLFEVQRSQPLEELWFDSYSRTSTNNLTSATVLDSGALYAVSIEGTFTVWSSFQGSQNGKGSTPPLYPSSGGTNTHAYFDASYVFDYPTAAYPELPVHHSIFRFTGLAPSEIGNDETVIPNILPINSYTDAHNYIYPVKGNGGNLFFRFYDTPQTDNSGMFKINLYTNPNSVIYSYPSQAFDEDGDSLKYRILVAPTGTSIDPITGELFWFPQQSDTGSHIFKLEVEDEHGATGTQEFSVLVSYENSVPLITSAPVTEAMSTEEYRYAIEASDPDGDSITLEFVSGPAGMILDSSTLIWTPDSNTFDVHSAAIKVTDEYGLSTAQSFDIFVDHPKFHNNAPVITSTPSLQIKGRTYTYQVIATDADGDSLTYSFLEAPEGMTIDSTGLLSWTPANDLSGTFNVFISVKDEWDEATQGFSFDIDVYNEPPVITSTPVETVMQGDTYLYEVTATDPEGDAVIFELAGYPTGMTITADGMLSWDTEGFSVNTYSVVVKASNTDGGADYQTFEIAVLPANEKPDLKPELLDISELTVDDVTLACSGSVFVAVQNNAYYANVEEPFNVVLFEDRNADGVFDEESDNLLYNAEIRSGVDAGQIASIEYTIYDTLLFSNSVITAIVDVNNTIDEENESNNSINSTYDCYSTAMPGNFNPVVEWTWGNGRTNNIIASPIVVQLNDDNGDGAIDENDTPDIVTLEHDKAWFDAGATIIAISGADRSTLWTYHQDFPNRSNNLAAGDIDGDGLVEIVTMRALYNDVIALNHDGSKKWQSRLFLLSDEEYHSRTVTIANIDGTGNPEVIIGNHVFNGSNGSKRWTGSAGTGDAMATPADVNLDGTLEIVVGNTLYSNSGAVIWQDTTIGDGYTGVANFNADPFPEIVNVADGVVSLLDYTGKILWSTELPGGGHGGPPTIANLDNDGYPEIGVAGGNYYVVFDHTGEVVWKDACQDHSSNRTGSSVFDFDGNGIAEIVYGDEKAFTIYDGRNGDVLFVDSSHSSPTALELPVIVDIDNDSSAEIIVVGDFGVRVYGSADSSWNATRSIWNQHNYHITNVNENGTIPAVEANSWTEFNTYRCNEAFGAFRCVDLTASYLKAVSNDTQDSATVTARIGNGGALGTVATIPVAFYQRVAGKDSLIATTEVTTPIASGSYTEVSVNYAASESRLDTIVVVVDDSGNGKGAIREIDEDNNRTEAVFYLKNEAPQLNFAPVLTANEGVLYTDSVIAVDPEGEAVHFALQKAPEGMKIDRLTGKITWTPAMHGPAEVTVAAVDRFGAIGNGTYTINVTPNSTSKIISTPDTLIYLGETFNYLIETADRSIPAANITMPLGAEGAVLTGKEINWTPTEEQLGWHDFSVQAVDGSGITATQNFTVKVAIKDTLGDTEGPKVSVSYTPASPAIGEEVTFSVTVTDNEAVDSSRIWLKVNDEYLTLVDGKATWTATIGRVLPILATAYDKAGNYGDKYRTITVTTSGTDTQDPTADIISPEMDTALAGMAPIIGTASDDNFAYYTLKVKSVDGTEWKEIKRGTTAMTAGELGTLDATLLENGNYYLLLTVYDQYGNVSAKQSMFRATGVKKIGHFSLAFTDMTLNLPGLALTAGRIYDSRNKEKGDFGYGWNLDLSSMKVSENVNQGEYWEITKGSGMASLQGFTLEPTRDHNVTISIPGGRDQVFKAVAKLYNRYDPNQAYMTYEAQQGTYGKLEQLDCGDMYNQGGIYYDINGDFIEPYNPQRYKLTLLDGTAYIFDQNVGRITTMIDPNGNRVDLAGDKITHSAGDTLNFIRDGENRIVEITDGERSVKYNYDGHGNLAKVTDPMGYVTQFKYAENHYLDEIIDPRGVSAIRTVYDDNGRVKYQINAESDTLTYDHDLTAGKSSTTDFGGNKTEYSYDNDGNVTMQVNAVGDTLRYEYDANGNQTKVTNPDGTFRTSKYDANGNITVLVNEKGDSVKVAYNGDGKITVETDALGRTKEYKYNSDGKLQSFVGPKGEVINTTTYGSNGQVDSETNALGYTTNYRYNNRGLLSQKILASGDTTKFEYDSRGNKVKEISGRGDTVQYKYDLNNKCTETISSNGHQAISTYTNFGKVETQTNKRGQVKSFSYNVFGQLDSTFHSDGSITVKSYDSRGNVKTSTDKVGRTTTFQHDHAGRVVKTTLFDGTFTETKYNNRGFKIKTISVFGDTTKFEYDEVGNNTAIITSMGDTTKFEYDAVGHKIAMIDALNQRTEYSYSDHDRLDTTTYHDGSYTVLEYDVLGRKTAEIDAENNRTTFEYDSTGALIKVTDALNQTTVTEYDSLNQKSALVDANGNVTNLVYDSLGRMVEKQYPAVEGRRDSERFIYNDLNELVQTIVGTDTTDIEYDSLGRETLKTYRNSGNTVATFYNIEGQVDSVIDYRGTTSYQYDPRGRQSKVTNPDGTFIEYIYDASDNKIKTITPMDTTEFTYDALNRMVHTIKGTDTTTYFYNAVGNRDSVTYGNGTASAYEYDVLNRLTKVTNFGTDRSVLSSYEYILNKAGIRTAVVEANGDSVLYTYDDLYRLTNERRAGLRAYEISYEYDKVGNRVKQVKDGVTTTYIYNERDQIEWEIVGSDSTGYAYDKSGRLYMKHDKVGTSWYNWTDNNRLRQLITPDTTITYEYDFRGVKVKEGDKTLLVDHSQHYAQVIGEIEGTDTVSYTFGLERIAQNRNDTVHYYLADGQGSIRQLTDAAGTVTDQYSYYGFGETLYETGSTENSFRYTGESYDPNSGFYYLRARWMNPSLGRFVSVDPYGGKQNSPISLHRYLYADQSPISKIDPTGEFSFAQQMAAVLTVSILANVAISTATLAKAGAQGADMSIDGVLFSFRLDLSVKGVMGGSGADMIIDTRTGKLWMSLAVEVGLDPASFYAKKFGGLGGTAVGGVIFGMSHPQDMSGLGFAAFWPASTMKFFSRFVSGRMSAIGAMSKFANNIRTPGISLGLGTGTGDAGFFAFGPSSRIFSTAIGYNDPYVSVDEIAPFWRDKFSRAIDGARELASYAGNQMSTFAENAENALLSLYF